MRYVIDHDFHIHSTLSPCCKTPEQTTQRILQYAKDNGLKTIMLTDHFWDVAAGPAPSAWYERLPLSHICAAKPLPQDENVKFLFGGETDMTAELMLGLSKEQMAELDFIVIPTTHMHFSFTTRDEEKESVQGRVNAWIRRLEGVLNMDLPFHKVGLAHLTCRVTWREEDRYLQVFSAIPEAELVRLFTKAAKLGVGIEINQDDMKYAHLNPDILLRPYRIAKACGCKFYLGSDSHKPEELDTAMENFQWAVDMLELTEEDKFVLL